MSLTVVSCNKPAVLDLVFAWAGALSYPSYYPLCEGCADHFCAKLEAGELSQGESPAYLHCIPRDAGAPKTCQMRRLART